MKKFIIALCAIVALVSCAPKTEAPQPLRLNCLISVSPENRDAVIDLAKTLVEASLQDEGNIAYDIFESVTDSSCLMIFETWKDQESLDKHSAAEHFTTLVPQIAELGQMQLDSMQAGAEPEGEFVLRLNCPTVVTEETREAAIELCKELVEASRADEGNISYDAFVSCTDPCKMLIFETWQNQEVLDKHSATPEFGENVGIMSQCGELKLESFNF